MKLLFCLMMIATVMFGHESSWGKEEELRLILRAQNISDLEKSQKNFNQLKSLISACQSQLRSKVAPSACLQLVDSEFKDGLLDREQLDVQKSWLLDLCQKIAKASHDIDELFALSELESESCSAPARQRLADLLYKMKVDEPHRLFALRFRLKSSSIRPSDNVERVLK